MDSENERNARLLESLKMKESRLEEDLAFYKKRPRSEKQIWMDGWAACEAVKGIMSVKYSGN